MTDTASLDQASQPLQLRNFYLARQPMLDRNQALFGYELLFRHTADNSAAIDSDMAATAAVLAHAAQLGLPRAVGDAVAFLNVDTEVLMSDIFAFLPREHTVLELVGSVEATEPVLWRLAELSGHGFKFAAEASAHGSRLGRLLPLLDYVKVNLRAMPLVTMLSLVPRLRGTGKRLIAEKVENQTEYKTCLDLGFDYFQGFYFARPSVIAGRKLSPSQLAIVDLMNLVMSDADNSAIERAIKRDVTLSLNLLRMVNTPAAGLRQRIDSLAQALIVVGRRQLQRWLQIMLYAEPGNRGHTQTPLLMLASTRARLMELLAGRLRPGQRHLADMAFTVGIMSLMDTLFCVPMADLVEQIPVSDEVAGALLRRSGFFGELLRLAESFEQMEEGDAMLPTLGALAKGGDDLVELELAAFEWSGQVVRSAL
ncbi:MULTISPECIES: EAL and HDOD domain-containing protein [unclassified Massilia]|uniref:EAL and HDOD domain-containing protein n=1 Tax=unclassified Massilia TaxID=2609279 RepID=UPI0017873C62|nr:MULTISPECIES: HDOD domain-containing protein [unclassified Massilia]MBD8530622.1 EAL domain-containing protein [Massilia sp. CFBP 13647]MBD8674847.1 EAL domain-containing protein [Massilia sp. CFBP 13721]